MLKYYLAVATCAVAAVLADDPKLKPFFGNDYKLETTDEATYTALLKKIGIDEEKVNKLKAAEPIIELTYDEATQKYTLETRGTLDLNSKDTFKLDEEGDSTKYCGIAGKSTFKVEGEDTLVETHVVAGKTVVIHYKFFADKLETTIDHEGTTTNRVFKLTDLKLNKFFANQYELETADKENYATILTKLGVCQASVDKIKETKPIIGLTYNKDTQDYILGFKGTPGFDHEEKFHLGHEGDIFKYGLAGKSTYKIEGDDTIKDICKIKEKTVEITWKFSEDKLEGTVVHDGTTANRVYIRKYQTDTLRAGLAVAAAPATPATPATPAAPATPGA